MSFAGFCCPLVPSSFQHREVVVKPHPVLASRNVFMPCATERLTRSWFRWWFRKPSSTQCILWNAPLPSNCRKSSLSSESPILKNVISSWWWPFHPGFRKHPYLPQTLPLTSPQLQPLTRSFELNLSSSADRRDLPTSPRVNFKENPSLNRSMYIYIYIRQCRKI